MTASTAKYCFPQGGHMIVTQLHHLLLLPQWTTPPDLKFILNFRQQC